MPPLTPEEQGRLARDAAIERAELGANPVWAVTALWAVRFLASRRPSFTTDDVWAVLDDLQVETPERRALGGVMRHAAAAGFITPTDTFIRSHRPECHCRPVLCWRSLLFGHVPLSSPYAPASPDA